MIGINHSGDWMQLESFFCCVIERSSSSDKRSVSLYRASSCLIMSSIGHLNLMTLAGFPTAIAYGGIDFVTTEDAPIIAPLPIVTPGNKVTFIPIHTSSSTITSPYSLSSLPPLKNCPIFCLWFDVITTNPSAVRHPRLIMNLLLPIVRIVERRPMRALSYKKMFSGFFKSAGIPNAAFLPK